MRKIKKFMSLTLSIVLSLSLFSCGAIENTAESDAALSEISESTELPSNSEKIEQIINSEDFQNTLEMVREPADLLGTGKDTTKAYVGGWFQTASVNEELFLKPNDNIFFPIIADDSIAVFINVSYDDNGESHIGAGTYWSAELEDAIISGESIAILNSSNGIYAVNENNKTSLIFDNPEVTTSDEDFENAFKFDEASQFNNVVSKDTIFKKWDE